MMLCLGSAMARGIAESVAGTGVMAKQYSCRADGSRKAWAASNRPIVQRLLRRSATQQVAIQ